MERLYVLYILSLVFAIIGSLGVINDNFRKVTSIVQLCGLLGICIDAILRYDIINVIIIMGIHIVVGFFAYFIIVSGISRRS